MVCIISISECSAVRRSNSVVGQQLECNAMQSRTRVSMVELSCWPTYLKVALAHSYESMSGASRTRRDPIAMRQQDSVDMPTARARS
jgi:hypothetical protein